MVYKVYETINHLHTINHINEKTHSMIKPFTWLLYPMGKPLMEKNKGRDLISFCEQGNNERILRIYQNIYTNRGTMITLH